LKAVHLTWNSNAPNYIYCVRKLQGFKVLLTTYPKSNT
jgi:hypothetical protein